jgi:carbamoyltransferase
MIYWGINALNHGSSLAVFNNNKLVQFSTAEADQVRDLDTATALKLGAPNRIFWYERPWIKKARQIYAGQYSTAMDMALLPSWHLKPFDYAAITYTPHHASHAAAGYYTSPFDHCAVVVLDAIGEFECATIWSGKQGRLKKLWSRSYPHSLGLFYSAFTQLCGLTPIKNEHLLQQMSDQGDHRRYYHDVLAYMNIPVRAGKNMHRGIQDWPYAVNNLGDQCDIAAAVQHVFTEQVQFVMQKAKELTNSDCLVYMGGCAMNSKANRAVVEPMFRYRWSLPNPGDPSSSIGAVLYHTRQRVLDRTWDSIKHLAINV